MVDPEADEIIETWLLKDFKTIVFEKKKKDFVFVFFPLFTTSPTQFSGV